MLLELFDNEVLQWAISQGWRYRNWYWAYGLGKQVSLAQTRHICGSHVHFLFLVCGV